MVLADAEGVLRLRRCPEREAAPVYREQASQ